MIAVGARAPAFTVSDEQGRSVTLDDYSGRTVVFYFYPKDDTPGCTIEACKFRDNYDSIKDKGAEVVGVSADDVQSHIAFSRKMALPFPLLSDPSHQMIEAWGPGGRSNERDEV